MSQEKWDWRPKALPPAPTRPASQAMTGIPTPTLESQGTAPGGRTRALKRPLDKETGDQ